MAAVDGSSNQESHHEPAEIPAHERPVIKTEKEKGKKWSDEAIADLANAFQTHECLWNMNLAEYRNKDMKNLAYEKTDEIMIAHGFTRDEYKKKWGILLGSFYVNTIMKILRRNRVQVWERFIKVLGHITSNWNSSDAVRL